VSSIFWVKEESLHVCPQETHLKKRKKKKKKRGRERETWGCTLEEDDSRQVLIVAPFNSARTKNAQNMWLYLRFFFKFEIFEFINLI
jgi:hypothetical protein